MKRKNVTRSGKAVGKARLPIIGSKIPRSPSISASMTAWPFEGMIVGLPISQRTKNTRRAETIQPVIMLLVRVNPDPSSKRAALGATPPPSLAKATEPAKTAARNVRSCVGRDMRARRLKMRKGSKVLCPTLRQLSKSPRLQDGARISGTSRGSVCANDR